MVIANKAHAHVPKIYKYPEKHNEQGPRRKAASNPGIDFRVIRRIMAGVLVVSLALLVVYRYGHISQTNMEINRFTKTRNALLDEQRHLEIAISQLTTLDRLEKIGTEELGLIYPHPGQIRYVGSRTPERGDGDGE